MEGSLLNTRLTKFEYFASLIIILLIVANVASFFYGVKFGADEMESNYLEIMNKDKMPDRSKDAYHQQHIVSYYYTVYDPILRFEKEWFDFYNMLQYSTNASSIEKRLGELQEIAGTELKRIETVQMPKSSSFLVEAQTNVMKSLTLFAQALDTLKTKQNTNDPSKLLNQIKANADVTQAGNFALLARQQYYTSIVEWNKTINRQIEGTTLMNKSSVTIDEWKTLNLNFKNQLVAQILTKAKTYTPALPQDYVGRIDEVVRSGKTGQLNLKTVADIVQMLTATNAVRKGDFATMRDKFYNDEFVPAIPFYTN